MKKKRGNDFVFLRIGVVGSVIFAYIGYLLAAALNIGQEEEISVLGAFVRTIMEPSSRSFNHFSPITMLLGIIVFETIYTGVLYLTSSPEEVEDDVSQEYQADVLDRIDFDDIEKSNAEDQEIFSRAVSNVKRDYPEEKEGAEDFSALFVSPSEVEEKNEPERRNADTEIATEEQEPRLSAEITDEIIGCGYSVDQVIAMTRIKKYMKDVTADMLMRMYRIDMSPEEIRMSIKMFYE